jgi:hypothetical protein
MTQTEVNTIVKYSERFNKPIDSLLRKLSRKYTQKKAKEIIRKAFNVSLGYS